MENPIKTFPGFLLRLVSQKFMAELAQKLKVLNVRISDGTILLCIQSNPGIRQSKIGHELNIARANMAPIIAKLENKGLVRKEALDGRSFGLFLTPEGSDLTSDILTVMKDHEQRITDQIPEQDRDSFIQALSNLYKTRLD